VRGRAWGSIVAVLAAAVAWCAPAGAAQVSGSLQVTVTGPTSISFTFTTKRACAGGEQCDYFSELDQLDDDTSCPLGRPSNPWILWTGDVQNTGPTTETGQATPRGWNAVAPRTRVCLYTYAEGEYSLTASALIAQPPGGAPGGGSTPGGTQPGGPNGTSPRSPGTGSAATDCARYPYQQNAQAALKADPTLAAGLDRNGNGVACETLPKRKTYISTVALRKAATAARAGLRDMYGAYFLNRHRYHERCVRITRTRVRCSVSWRYDGGTWRGSVSVVGRLRNNKSVLVARPHVLRPV
jgi:hypothetical protein